MTAPWQQKLRVSGPVVVTANRLADGAVIYATENGGWSTDLGNAAVATTADDARRLLTTASAAGRIAVGAYVAPVQLEGGRIAPGSLRETIRRQGPTIALPSTLRS